MRSTVPSTADPDEVSWAQVSARRLIRSHLAEPAATDDVAGVVHDILAAHSQMPSAGELSVALRFEGGTVEMVRRAVDEEHTVVRTFGPRGTIHLLPSGDLPMWTDVLGSIPTGPSPFPPDVRLSDEQTEEVVAAIAAALASKELTIDELSDAVVDLTGPWAGDLVMPAFQTVWPRWRQAISLAAHRGVLCFGPKQGRKITYTHPARYVPDLGRSAPGDAESRLLFNYLHTYGPASPGDFAQWIGAPPSWAKELFARSADDLQPVDLEGRPGYVNRGDASWPIEPPAGVRLLPYFDAYVIACQPRDLLYPGRATPRARAPSGQAGNYPVLLVDGVVAGVWHMRRSGRKAQLTVEPLRALTVSRRRALDHEVERLAAALDVTPDLTIGEVTVGPHA